MQYKVQTYARRQSRTADTRIFSAVLYQLSYPSVLIGWGPLLTPSLTQSAKRVRYADRVAPFSTAERRSTGRFYKSSAGSMYPWF